MTSLKNKIDDTIKIRKPEGFKYSNEIIIPNDWEVCKLQEVADVRDGTHDSPKYVASGIPFITSKNLVNGQVDWHDINYILEEDHIKFSQRSYVEDGDILFAMIGTIGNAVIVKKEFEFSIKNVALIKFHNSDMNNRFVLNLLKSDTIEKQFKRKTNTAVQKFISLGMIRELYIPVPKKNEQNRIAEYLGIWDQAIELKEKLIEEKKKQKTGLMQMLLTGKVRLPGFDGEWKEEKIGNIAKQSTNKNSDNKISKVLSCTKYNGLVDSLGYFGKQIYSDDITKYKTVHKGEICYATNHIEEGSIGILEEYDAGVVSPMYTVFKVSKTQDNAFVFLVLKSPMYVEHYKSLMSASVNRRGSLRWGTFKNITINCPPIEEQKALAKFFKLAEKSIELHEKELEALKQQKKGLMQLLLTGIVRVNTN